MTTPPRSTAPAPEPTPARSPGDSPADSAGHSPGHSPGPAPELLEALAFAGELVTRLGEHAAPLQQGVVEHSKPEQRSLAGTVVTDVDVELERLVDEAVAERYPEDGLLGEEGTERTGTSGRTWVVDPVDGTLNFSRRIGPWSVVVTAWDGEHPLLSAVWTGGVLYTALRGHGAWRDGQLLVQPERAEAGGVVRSTATMTGDVARAGWLARTVESSAAELVAVADGRFVGALRMRGDRRDLHGPALIVAESGATVTDLVGGAWDGSSPGLVLAHPDAHAGLLELARTAGQGHRD